MTIEELKSDIAACISINERDGTGDEWYSTCASDKLKKLCAHIGADPAIDQGRV